MRAGQTESPSRQVALRVEQLVLEVDHPGPLGEQVPAAAQSHRMGSGGPVKRLRNRCSPVHYEGLLVDVGYGQAADVERLFRPTVVAGSPVDATEDQGFPAELELLQTAETGSNTNVPFGYRLVGPPRSPKASWSMDSADALMAASRS